MCDEEASSDFFPARSSTRGGLADILVRVFAIMPEADAHRLMSESLSDPTVVAPGAVAADELMTRASEVWASVPSGIDAAKRKAEDETFRGEQYHPLLKALYALSDAVRRTDSMRARALDAVEREEQKARRVAPQMVSAESVDDE